MSTTSPLSFIESHALWSLNIPEFAPFPKSSSDAMLISSEEGRSTEVTPNIEIRKAKTPSGESTLFHHGEFLTSAEVGRDTYSCRNELNNL